MEAFGPDDEPVPASGPRGELDGVCDMGMLTDRGRETAGALGARLRTLYVDRLGFLPPAVADARADGLYLRATPIPRALESLQEAFAGLYPPRARAPGFPPPTILARAPADETLFPNDSNCRRFAALSRAFAQRAADRWNAAEEMAYLTKLWGGWMPEAPGGRHPRGGVVAVDSRPRLSGIMDTVNATLAHGPETRLPAEFYDPRAREIMARVAVEEWFAGYAESREYRALGIGALMGDVVGRMVTGAERSSAPAAGEPDVRFGLSGCHDTTLAGVLASLGTFGTADKWPPFTSHVAIEMFRRKRSSAAAGGGESSGGEGAGTIPPAENGGGGGGAEQKSSWLGSLLPWTRASPASPRARPGIGRKRSEELSPEERARLDGYYVRLRYNDGVVTVPGCRAPGKHLEGDESFCTLVRSPPPPPFPYLDGIAYVYINTNQYHAFRFVGDKQKKDKKKKEKNSEKGD